jgi:hypothetical protein
MSFYFPGSLRLLAVPLLLLALVGSSIGCAAPQRAGRNRALSQLSFAMQQAYRWKDWGTVERMLDPPLLEAFAQRFVRPGDSLSITDVEILQVEMPDQQADAGRIRVELRWVQLPSVSEHATTLDCTLVFRGGQWWVTGQREVGAGEVGGAFDL